MISRILIVDDSLTVRMDLAAAFKTAGFDTQLCATIGSARAALESDRFDLIILDLLLPDGDGLVFLQEIKSNASTQIPAMLLTTEGEVRHRVQGMSAGADEYIGKPYDLVQVVARARALTERRSRDEEKPPGRRILIIEDSATFRDELRRALEGANYTVEEATTGEEGLALVATLRPDALVTDGTLPGIDGATVVRRLKSDMALRSTPCLLLTASGGAGDELRALEAGADAYVHKSEDMRVILLRLDALLRQSVTSHVPASPSLLGPKRILAVDDSRTYLHALGAQLQQEGYDVVLAESGEEALKLLAAQPVDCILLDLMMPGLSGLETCRHIKQTAAWRDIPLLMLTSHDEHEAMISGINAGADDYIAKSAEFDVLKARLRAQLRRKHFEDENRRMREQLNEKVAAENLQKYARALEETNRALEKEKARAEQESHFKSKFLAGMSHELRTPLNAIIGFSDLLDQELFGPLNPRQKECVGDVLASGRHLLTLVNDILDLSKVAAGRVDLSFTWVQLRSVIDAVHSVVRPLSDQRGVTIEVSTAADLPELYIDQVRIKQVLYNLLSNAIKFTPSAGRVDLTAAVEGNFCRVACKDTGVGIAAADMHRLFREFEQIQTNTREKSEGTGLGLALTKRLVEMHGGTITATSERGVGSTFVFTLPLQPVLTGESSRRES